MYPASHWGRLKRFAVGDEQDPRGLFRLTDDVWNAWPYAVNGAPSQARLFRFHFGRFRTFLKLYAKWHCYHMLIGNPGGLTAYFATLPAQLMFADRHIGEQHFRSIDDLASTPVFELLWDSLIKEPYAASPSRPRCAVSTQVATRTFWRRISLEFELPFVVPPVAPHVRLWPAEFAVDTSKLIPEHVIKKLTNKLALHRDSRELLTRFDHLRLCVLILVICLGRRIHEILLSPRREGADGPLRRHPSKSAALEGSLWFNFTPNKEGPDDEVFVSPEWEDIALYCVRELVKYGDEVRHLAAGQERGHLILISTVNSTKSGRHRDEPHASDEEHARRPRASEAEGNQGFLAHGLRYESFNWWLNGTGRRKGVLELWGITADGTDDGTVYRLLTSYSRHSRQSALAVNPQIDPLTRQRDLNHRDMSMQLVYQHRLLENNDTLLEKIKEGKLLGRGVEWLSLLLEVEVRDSRARPGFQAGHPSPMTPRMYALVRNNPIFLQQNRVPCGICMLPQGPGGCAEFLNCTSACEGGCHHFVVDVDDARMLHELNNRACEERRLHGESVAAGRVVQAQKRAALAARTEGLRDEAMRRASEVALADLRRLQKEISEEGL